MPAPTPLELPEASKLYELTLPDGEDWFALFLGALLYLIDAKYYTQTPGGMTPEDTALVWVELLSQLRFDLGE